jgi:hypothetical protein
VMADQARDVGIVLNQENARFHEAYCSWSIR